MRPLNLIQTATLTAARSTGRLRRAVSTNFALFTCLANACADTLVGGSSSDRSDRAWQFIHPARDAASKLDFPPEIQDFAELFSIAQHLRERADYNPDAVFTKSNVIRQIADAERVIREFNRCRTAGHSQYTCSCQCAIDYYRTAR